MRLSMPLAWLVASAVAMPLSAQESAGPWTPGAARPIQGANPFSVPQPVGIEDSSSASQEAAPSADPVWRPVWGLAGLQVFAAGPKVAPNGQKYHPSFSLDLDLNLWIWQSQGFYLFGDARFWGERPEMGVTNARDGGLGFSKRQFDLSGGPAWNYCGQWEARVSGYSFANLNRGSDPIAPHGGLDGALLENRYYLSEEYAKLGQAGFDVARAPFVSVGYYPTKSMVGNNGQTFIPGLMLRAYLTCDLWDWPAYLFGDASFITERSLQPKLLLFDLGVAARPFGSWRQWEFRLGVENTADLETKGVLNLEYVSLRYLF
jgi:hypothetical protein